MTPEKRIDQLEKSLAELQGQLHDTGEHLALVSQSLKAVVAMAQDCDARQEERIEALELRHSLPPVCLN